MAHIVPPKSVRWNQQYHRNRWAGRFWIRKSRFQRLQLFWLVVCWEKDLAVSYSGLYQLLTLDARRPEADYHVDKETARGALFQLFTATASLYSNHFCLHHFFHLSGTRESRHCKRCGQIRIARQCQRDHTGVKDADDDSACFWGRLFVKLPSGLVIPTRLSACLVH